MKRMKKLFAVLMALTMVLGMTMTANAAIINPECPAAGDTAEVSVANLDEGLTVKAYQIVDADYYDTAAGEKEHGFKGYVVVDAVKNLLAPAVYDMENPVSEHITTIAYAIEEGTITLAEPVTLTYADGKYKADLTAGAWIILVDSKDDENGVDINIYNPMLAGVYYTNTTGSGNDITGGNEIDATSNWALAGTEMYAKSTITNFDKLIVNSSEEIAGTDDVNENADSVAIGDTVTYELDTYMPKYSLAYKELKFTLTDTLSAGLTPCEPSGVTVKAGGEVITEGFTVKVEGQVITVDFTEAGIRANGGKEIVVTYTAELNENAVLDQNQNPNNAQLVFTNNPNGETDHKEDVTYHHTFEFQVKKVDEKGALIKDAEGNPLAAEFTLTRTDKDGYVYVEESDDAGMITFTGLDAGTYTLVETKAPAGYQIDNTERTVVIEADYAEDGEIQSYTITIAGKVVETWTNTAAEVTYDTLSIMNTKLIALPSTGGMGTTLFTIAGCGIMIAAAFFFFASRRREYR